MEWPARIVEATPLLKAGVWIPTLEGGTSPLGEGATNGRKALN